VCKWGKFVLWGGEFSFESHSGEHPEEALVKCGYEPNMKYKILIILLIYLATKLETKYKDLAICI
jgi:hypothetical protein